MEIEKLCEAKFCKLYLDNLSLKKRDASVFYYDCGELVGCGDYNCVYGNHDGQKFFHEGDGPEFGFCNTFGLKLDIEKSDLISKIIQGLIRYKELEAFLDI